MGNKRQYRCESKVYGIVNEDEIKIMNKIKPGFCGFMIGEEDKRGYVTKEKAIELNQKLNEKVTSIAMINNIPFVEAAEFLREGGFDIVQLTGDEDEGYIDTLKAALLDKEIWKTYKIKREDSDSDVKRILRAAENTLADIVVIDVEKRMEPLIDFMTINELKRPYVIEGDIIDSETVSSCIANSGIYCVGCDKDLNEAFTKEEDRVRKFVRNVFIWGAI